METQTKICENTGMKQEKLTREQKEQLVNLLKQDYEEKMSAWNIDAFWKYIMQYCTKKENIKLYINLPAKWEFKWFNFECKIRDLKIFLNGGTSYEDTKLGEKISNLLYELENYLKAYWIKTYDEYELQDRILYPIFKEYHII